MKATLLGLAAVTMLAHTVLADDAPTASTATDAGTAGTIENTIATGSDKVLLRLHLQPGHSFNLHEVTTTKMTEILPRAISGHTASMPGMKNGRLDIDITSMADVRYDVVSVDPHGVTSIKLTYISVKTKMGKLPGAPVSAAAPQFTTGLIGQSITMKITPEGHITDLKGMDALVKRMMAGMSGPKGVKMPPAVQASMQKTFKQTFGDQFFKQVMEKSTLGYPAKPVGVGDTWTYQTAVTGNLPLRVKGTRTLTARSNGLATIDEKADLSVNMAPGAMNLQPMQMSFDIKGTQSGSSQMDEATGFTRSSHLSQRMSGTIRMKGIPHQPGTLSVPLYAKTDITLSVTPIAAIASAKTP